VGFGAGGVLETVVDGTTGAFFHRHDPEALLDAVGRADALASPPASIARHAQRFSVTAFRARIHAAVASADEGR
jgi:hypothetical protein